MWSWIAGGYVVLVAVACGVAMYVALFVAEESRREMAYRVLKLVLSAATGAGGVFAVALKLYDAGLL